MLTKLLRAHHKFETVIVGSLLVLMMFVVLIATLEFVVLLFEGIRARLMHAGTVNFMRREMHELFGGFLVILLGIELMETIRMYLVEHVIHVEIVYLVAMIAVGRHVIELDFEQTGTLVPFGIAGIMLALAMGYFVVKKAPDSASPDHSEKAMEPKAEKSES